MSDAVRYLGMHVDPPGEVADLGGMTLRALGLVTGGMPAADDAAFHGSTAGLVTVRPTMVGRCKLKSFESRVDACVESAWFRRGTTTFKCCFRLQIAPLHHARHRSVRADVPPQGQRRGGHERMRR
jgi:hypothetical protein